MSKNSDLYLVALNEQEMTELYESLALRNELKRRLSETEGEKLSLSSTLLDKVSRRFTEKTTRNLKDAVINELDDYIDHQVDDEIMWNGIEEQLRKKFED